MTWQGPDYPGDYITISALGDDGYESYAYTSKGSPALLDLPETPGTYEIRYVIDQDLRVIAQVGLTVQ